MPHLTEQQRLAAQCIDDHAFVSAGAGCGKTLVLVHRYLEVLKQHPDSGVQNIIAVTFTRKAAEEMRTRIKGELRNLARENPEQQMRWHQLLGDVDRARIGTIHSLCESILRAYPAEARVDPQFEILDDLPRAQLLEGAIDGALGELFANPGANSSLLLEYPVDKLKEWVVAQLNAAPQFREARGRMGDDVDSMRAAAADVVNRAQMRLLHGVLEEEGFRRAFEYIESNPSDGGLLEERRRETLLCLRDFYEAAGTSDCQRMIDALQRLAGVPSPRTAGGAKGKPLREVLSQVRTVASELAERCPVQLGDEDERAFGLLQSLLMLIDDALLRYETAKRHQQKLDYNDLILKTHNLLLRRDAVVRRAMGNNLIAVLVDEFQDTNRLQSELLSALCGPNTRLFLIGDDKQSIYKFQGADVSNFNDWKQKIAENQHGLDGGARHFSLDLSFRSHPSVVDFVNRFFKSHFAAETRGAFHGASFQALKTARNESSKPDHVELVVYETGEADHARAGNDAARTMEARAVAAWILEKVGNKAPIRKKNAAPTQRREDDYRPLEFGDIAILVQSSQDFAVIEPALAEANIPFVTFAGGGFLKRQEVVDIQNLLRFLANPLDDHALLAALRSPLFSLNDGTIQMVFDAETGPLWYRLQAAARKEEFAALGRPAAILRQLLSDAQHLSISDLISEAISLTAVDVSLLAVRGGKQKSRNVWKLADFSRQYDDLSLTDFVRAFDLLREMDGGKQSDAPLAAENAVKLMTIHKAKGLEFGAVILPVLGRKVHLQPGKLLVHREYGIALDTSRTQEDPKPSYFRAAQVLDEEMDEQEKKRLLYVAMTRARDWLVMFVQQNASNYISFRLWLDKTLNLSSTQSSGATAMQDGQHYVSRHVDEEALRDWEASARTAASALQSYDDLQMIAANTRFSLSAPVDLHIEREMRPPAWQSLLRATAPKDTQPHAALIGDLFHAAMQQRIQGVEVSEAQLGALASSSQLAVVDEHSRNQMIAECSRLLSLYEGSELFQILQTARRVFSEIDYTAFADGVPMEKRPDLIIQDQHGHWQIIDFKTDKVDDPHLPAKLNEHADQVLEYAKDFEALTGNKAQTFIYFAELARLEEVKGKGYAVSKGGQLKLFGS